jgi:hypothetical protein
MWLCSANTCLIVECKRPILYRLCLQVHLPCLQLQSADQDSILDHGRNDVDMLEEMRLELK